MGARVTIGTVLIGVNVLVLCLTEYMTLSQGKFQLALVALAMNAINIAYLHLAFKTQNDYLKIFGLVMILHHLHRIPFFVDPSFPSIYNPLLAVWGIPTESEINYSLLVILCYQVIGGVTILICGGMFRLRLYLDRTSELDRDFFPLFFWYCLLQAVFLYDYVVLGVGRLGIESTPLGWIGLVLSSQLALVLLAFVIFINWKRYDHAWLRIVAALYFVMAAVMTTVWGSRRGIYQFLIIGLITLMTVWPHRKWYVGVKKLALASVLLFAMVATYLVGTEYRKVVLFESKEPTVKAIMSVDALRPLLNLSYQHDFVFEGIWYRMSQLDDVTMSILMEDSRFAHEINFANNLRALANRLVIGDVFPGVLVTGRVWAVDYYGKSVSYVQKNYLTLVPGVFGFSIATFGVIGGLVGLSAVIGIFIFGANWGSVLVPLAYRKYYVLAIYHLFFGHVIAGMGFDQIGISIFLWIIQAGLIVGFVTSYKVFQRAFTQRHVTI